MATRAMDPEFDPEQDERELSLRPRSLADFQGQAKLKENLGLFIRAARERGEALDHLFLMGPPGLGKTTLALVVANELGVDFKPTSAPALEKPKDLAGVLTTLRERSVLFIDEIHRLRPAIEEMLYIAMEDFELDWIIGQGPAARTVRVPVPPSRSWVRRRRRVPSRRPCRVASASPSVSDITSPRNSKP